MQRRIVLAARPDAPPVVVLTGTKTVSTAVEAMKQGAADYVTKPFEVDALRIKVRRLLEQRALEERVAALSDELAERDRLGDLLGRSEGMRAVLVDGVFRADLMAASLALNGVYMVLGAAGFVGFFELARRDGQLLNTGE